MIDAGVFCTILCKFLHFLYFTMTDAIAYVSSFCLLSLFFFHMF